MPCRSRRPEKSGRKSLQSLRRPIRRRGDVESRDPSAEQWPSASGKRWYRRRLIPRQTSRAGGIFSSITGSAIRTPNEEPPHSRDCHQSVRTALDRRIGWLLVSNECPRNPAPSSFGSVSYVPVEIAFAAVG